MKVWRRYKMARNCKIKNNKGKDKLGQWRTCWKCNKKVKANALYVDYGNGAYHLSCFYTYGRKLVKRWELYKKRMEEHLNILDPYKKEMIVESLEKSEQNEEE